MDVFLDSASALTKGEGKERPGTLFQKIVFGIGSLPPGRFKVPKNLPKPFSRLAEPGALTRAESLRKFEEIGRRTHDLFAAVEAAPLGLRSKHPAAGWLNAAQWYQISEMHMRHHLRQLHRIEKNLPG